MSEKLPTISVIVPMYNAEKFLNCCIESVLNQTFRDFELILIDDCSTDKTLEISKSFSDSRIKILHTEKNLGRPGMTRNVGIDAARGKYFYFMDADDAILKNALEILLKTMTENNADIVYCSKWLEPDDSNFNKLVGQISAKMQGTSNDPVSNDLKYRIWNELCMHGMHSVLWLYLLKREVFHGENKIRFPNYLAEDVFVHFDILCGNFKIVKMDKPFYFYRTNPDSLTNSKKNVTGGLESIFALSNYVKQKLAQRNFPLKWINNIVLSLVNGVNSVLLLPALREDSEKFYLETGKYLEKKFGDNAEDVKMLLFNYLAAQNEWIKRMHLKNDVQNILDKYK